MITANHLQKYYNGFSLDCTMRLKPGSKQDSSVATEPVKAPPSKSYLASTISMAAKLPY